MENFRVVEKRNGRITRVLGGADSLDAAEKMHARYTIDARWPDLVIVDEQDIERVVRPSADQREVSELYTLAMRLVSLSDACPERVVRTVVDMLHDDAARKTTSANDKRRAIAAAGMILEYLEGR